MTRKEKTGKMLAHVAAQEQSGLTRKMYCQEQGISLNVLNYWCGKSKRPSHGQGFAHMQVSSGQNVELHYPNGVRLLLPSGAGVDHIAACIRLY